MISLEPSHACPASHFEHALRNPKSPPHVNDPAGHVKQAPDPGTENWLSLPAVSAPQLEHTPLPNLLYFPDGQSVSVLDPVQYCPVAQDEHAVRVRDDPPDVYDLPLHVEHVDEPSCEKRLSAPQSEHDDLPLMLNIPALQGVTVLVPSHHEPAAHSEHADRVVDVPSEVNDPTGHSVQLVAPRAEKKLSSPHGTQSTRPPALNLPASHGVVTLVPSHDIPLGHATHPDRMVVDPPVVIDPAAQVEHATAPATEYFSSLLHSRHALLPAALYLPATHVTMVLVPSHRSPARQRAHVSRMFVLPPDVNDPVAQSSHLPAPSPENVFSAPQAEQSALPSPLNVPPVHVPTELVPLHELPAGQERQVDRVSVVPPDVNELAAHLSQRAEESVLYMLSAPHTAHTFAPAALYVPAGHGALMLLPSHEYPAGHALHTVRVVVVPPDVIDPAGQTTHSIELALSEYWLSYPHAEHWYCPAMEYLPASHGTVLLDPSTHALPAGHEEHVVRVVSNPPLVNDPIGHVSHMLAPASAYFLSSPHATHVSLPEAANVPAIHLDTVPVVSHLDPVGHTLHAIRVVSVPPLVKEPAGQV